MNVCSLSYTFNGKLYVKVYTEKDVNRIEAFPRPYCFVPSVWSIESNLPTSVEKTDLKTIDTDERVTKYIFSYPFQVKTFRDNIERYGRRTYEADIMYTKRWMIDNNMQCSSYQNSKAYWDIEVLDEHGFPDENTADEPIIAITVKKDSIMETF
ncbi:MAG: hypothetical protein ACPL3B_07090, partial [Fervidobacterium sp.]